jgi:MYXO-CTERM domain-containing protein
VTDVGGKVNVAAVPEPGSLALALMLAGLGSVGVIARRRRQG